MTKTENSTNICGCSQQKLDGGSTEENLEECSICGIKTTCPYPREALLKMARGATEESPEETENLQTLARGSISFSDFHEKATQKRDRLNRQPQNKGKNLKQLARESLYFEEFHSKAQDV